ncbi:uncharacterized protein [Musca autumnalis]|uniref:uncharacterized protein n=1 Tax=Musca autumnalis TaxID=221902 RepID=UPI003CE920E3
MMRVRTTSETVGECCFSGPEDFGSGSRSRSKVVQQHGLRVLQINLHHCKAAAAELLLSLTDSAVDIALVQEPYLYKNRVSGLNNEHFSLFYTNNGDKVRTCIVARKSLNLIQLYNYSDGDTTVVRLDEVTGRALVLASVYMPYEAPDPPSGLVRKLVEETTGRCRLVMGCDANAHHFHWGSRDTNARAHHIIINSLHHHLQAYSTVQNIICSLTTSYRIAHNKEHITPSALTHHRIPYAQITIYPSVTQHHNL